MLFSLFMVFPPEKVSAEPDTTPPVAHGETLTLTLPEGKTTVTAGDTVEISLEVTDEHTAVQYVSFFFTEPGTGADQYVPFNKVGDTDEWKAVINITDNTRNGEWHVKYISVTDMVSNGKYIYRDSEEGQFLNNAAFTVEHLLGTLTLSKYFYIYDGEPKIPTATVTNGKGDTLTEGEDYTVAYFNNINVGTGKVTITGIGQYSGTASRNFFIKSATIGEVTLSQETYIYDGNPKTPTVTVKNLIGETLAEGEDYNLVYADNTNVGTAKVTVNGTGNYSGTVIKNFVINPTAIQEDKVALSKYTYTYDGLPKTPTVTVKNAKGETLTKGTDYNFVYADNTNVGTAKVTVSGIGNYSGKIIKTFVINPGSVNVQVKLYGHDDIHAAWEAPLAPEGVTINYKVEYMRSTWSDWSDDRVRPEETTDTYYKQPNLADGAMYKFRVTPYIEINGQTYEGEPSESSYIYTLKRIAAPRVSRSSRNYVRLRWTNIPGESGYQISRSRYKTKRFSTVKRVSYKYSTTRIKTTRNRRYYYKIRAYKTVDGKRIYAPWSKVRAYRLR